MYLAMRKNGQGQGSNTFCVEIYWNFDFYWHCLQTSRPLKKLTKQNNVSKNIYTNFTLSHRTIHRCRTKIFASIIQSPAISRFEIHSQDIHIGYRRNNVFLQKYKQKGKVKSIKKNIWWRCRCNWLCNPYNDSCVAN